MGRSQAFRRTIATLALAACPAASAMPAAAAEIDSAYTDIDLSACAQLSQDEWGGSWSCPGYGDIPVVISEGDLRFSISYGRKATSEPAASQTPPPFNSLGPKIEWRLRRDKGSWTPFATIVRYFVQKGDGGEAEGQVLVVTQLTPGATCHIAYVDALANADANRLARAVADEQAGRRPCPDQPEIVGAFSAWDAD